ncbi:TPA: hypothetical protein U1C34_001319 [Streptococcus suis]|nr:hypothetical protein [Streptococcus suis]HEM3622528.1 hypothetical protein [Streptococcus suis]HEM3626768.1 hypothetical protein [Streptococcus suis]HEM3628609.1 hypothetical protein [Streptococcus suis]HEM3631559.1 hypothetical protein [Streptococcus suis]
MKAFKGRDWLYPVNLILAILLAVSNYSRGSYGIGHIWLAVTIFWVIRLVMLWIQRKKK